MKSLQELFCDVYRCEQAEFSRKVFSLCLHRRAILLVPLLGGFRADYFAADRELIAGAGRAVNLNGVHSEVRDFHLDANNRGWLRKRAKVRISAQRLLTLSQNLFTQAEGARSVIGGDSK